MLNETDLKPYFLKKEIYEKEIKRSQQVIVSFDDNEMDFTL